MTGLLHAEALQELDDAIAWYEQRREGLGLELLAEVQSAISLAIAHPNRFPEAANGVRRCQTNRFPYGILYTCPGEQLFVVAVMHLHRDPDYWKHRIS